MSRLRQLPATDRWLLASVLFILVAIMVVIAYGVRQSELADDRERAYKQEIEAKSERNRLEIERNAAQAATAIEELKRQAEELKRQAAEVKARQAQSELRDVRGELRSLDRARREEQRQYEQKLKGIITSNLSACERWLKNCAVAKRLGLRDADAPCQCR